MRVMLDTNILISAFVFKSSIMNELINELSNEHEIMIASYCVDEIKNVTNSKFNINNKKLEKFFSTFPFTILYSPNDVNEEIFEIRDKNDYIILYTAITKNVDVFITGDKDFKEIKIDKPEILTAVEFLKKYKKNRN